MAKQKIQPVEKQEVESTEIQEEVKQELEAVIIPEKKQVVEKPFNPEEEAEFILLQVDELLKKSQDLQAKAGVKLGFIPTSLTITTAQLNRCYESIRLALGK